MDTSLPLIKQGHSGDSNVSSDGVDRISKLPDEVLSHILSYLTTKQAVATSILSKRWEYLWTFTTNLDFSDQIPYNFLDENEWGTKLRSFKDFVDRVIFYHGESTIQKCHLHTRQLYSNIYPWVCAVITCNVQELSIQGCSFAFQQLPWRLFACKTLVVLKIRGKFMLDLPTRICYPFLKILSLNGVVYMSDASMDRLFSGCPVLEELEIIRRTEDGVQIMKINTPSLKKLTIHYKVGHSENEHKTQLNTPFLEYLKFSGKSGGYSMNCSSSLVEAHIYGGCDLDLLNGISKVQHLVLNGQIMQDLLIIIGYHGLPKFNNLKKIELNVDNPLDWEVLPDLLECSPNLQVLVFPEGLAVMPEECANDYCHLQWYRPDCMPECLLYHLKTVEIFKFAGQPCDLDIVRFLLKYGEVLECMNIHCFDCSTRPIMRKELDGAISEVSNFKRCSSACKLAFFA
ncbi:FBD-associated F-box protein At4g10400-like [Mercurialis annua]|uniref:FBD-associated F-box protein At4g10400-like n=1 Tax=Mercurialis annua TaxID=3986 RepID=UPI00215FB561|nr:FBD-associated F-box protein At4g10400-like [Mercurialis annua]